MLSELVDEARRQIRICNVCRYCEGFCAVFPAIHRQRAFADGDIVQFANLCHNCRGCYYACQYVPPHEFEVNLPRVLAEVQQRSWKEFAWPRGVSELFDRSGVVMSIIVALSVAFLFGITAALPASGGEGFYAYMSHGLMVAIFMPSFLLPLLALGVSLRRYWNAIGGGALTWRNVLAATRSLGHMDNLSGGNGEGCNFEDQDRNSSVRRRLHHLALYGFLLCFASTCSGTVLHYGFGIEAPYGLFSIPKILGVPGGLMLCAGTAGLAWLKTRADRKLGAPSAWGGEMAFILLLFSVSASGLALYAATGGEAVGILLPVHLGFVFTLFLATPYSKMVHGFYRAAALLHNAKLVAAQN